MSSMFWEIIWLILLSFFLLAYLTVLFRIVVDLFRDASIGGFAKAIWLIALFVLPLLTALVYLVVRGQGMAERDLAEERRLKSEAEAYIRQAAATSPADQLVRAKTLLKEGAITDDEFEQLKQKALAH
ncbi:SHOCT domain-containing protein [Devosia nitrariae]|uniref:Membrane protein n=1 Tax=Devosia nitrariae TaxID=2071872 RepID=A0ABQ5W9V7_9HYPH|nr:SHOCT domain-containing protein [Devosia nitrariae]GLQ56833.1 membrane protein [Devosia nitrariae]